MEKQCEDDTRRDLPPVDGEKQLKFLLVSIMRGPQISGGRYYNTMLANSLRLAGHQVDYYSVTENHMLHEPFYTKPPEKHYDWIIGTPHAPASWAVKNKLLYGAKVAQVVYETPNWLKEYAMKFRSQPYLTYATQPMWNPFLEALRKSEMIICISNECANYTRSWIGMKDKDVRVIYPCINNWIADTVPTQPKENTVVYIGRQAHNKRTDSLRRAIEYLRTSKKVPLKYKYVGGHYEEWEKFAILKRASCLCLPSIFEGFGITPAEALYCRIPVVVYDLPVLKEAYKDNIINVSFDHGFDRFVEGIQMAIRTKIPLTTVEFIRKRYSIEAQTLAVKKVFG